MHTLTSDQLARLLRASAAGYRPSEAAAQLLTAHRGWLDRSDFRHACVDYDHDGHTPIAWVDWQAVPAFIAQRYTACSSSEARILCLATELAGVDTGHPLAELLASLDERNSALVLDAIAHALHLDTPGGAAMSARRERPVGLWCPECKGTGACQRCLGTGMRGYWIRLLCRACGGGRDCTWCDDTGNDPEARR